MNGKKLTVVLIAIIIGILLSPLVIETWDNQPTGGTLCALVIYEILIQELFIIFKKQNDKL